MLLLHLHLVLSVLLLHQLLVVLIHLVLVHDVLILDEVAGLRDLVSVVAGLGALRLVNLGWAVKVVVLALLVGVDIAGGVGVGS